MELTPPKFDPTEPQPFQAKPVCPFCGRLERYERDRNLDRDITIKVSEEGKIILHCKRCEGSWFSEPYAETAAQREARRKLLDVAWYEIGGKFIDFGTGLCLGAAITMTMLAACGRL